MLISFGVLQYFLNALTFHRFLALILKTTKSRSQEFQTFEQIRKFRNVQQFQTFQNIQNIQKIPNNQIKRQPKALDDFKSGKRDYEYFKNEYNSDIADLILFLGENVDIIDIDKIVKADNLTKSVTV